MKFLDQAKIYLKSGDGGRGCCSFRREKFVEYGGPDGGNGGKGGDIIFEAVSTLNTLIDFRYQQHYKAKNGRSGEGRNKTGASSEDMVIQVPVGTEILDEGRKTVLADLTEKGQRKKLLIGGDGGFGNAHYKSATNQAPRKTTPGWPGQELTVWLRLKLIADIGLVGLPNAGKSTFLASCTRARPKIADYPFTTLHPNLGVAKIGDFEYVIADIPGLIEGAHEGHGLGDQFLGHIERTNVLIHLVDGTSDTIKQDYDTIRNELEAYDKGLGEKNEIIALTKTDAIPHEDLKDRQKDLEIHTGMTIFPISSVASKGMTPLLHEAAKYIARESASKDMSEHL